MSDAFDPYHRWLGIPPAEQPPNHYRLLGIQLFEEDPDVIEAAGDQRMGHLRSYQSGRHSELSQRLLNEVAAAKVCLLNPQKKAEYDGQLGAGRGVARPAESLPVAQPIAATQEPAGPGLGAPAIHTSSVSHTYRRKKGSWQVPAALGAGALMVAGLLFALLSGEREPKVARNDNKPRQGPNSAQTVKQPRVGPDTAATDRGQPNVGNSGPSGSQSGDPSGESPPDATELPPDVTGLPPEDSDPEIQPETTQSPDPLEVDPWPIIPPSDRGPEGPKPLPVPPDADQEKALQAVLEVHREELDRSKTPEEKRTLGQKFLRLANETTDDPAARFVLLKLARDAANEGEDPVTAFRAVEDLARGFEIDTLEMKVAILAEFGKVARWPAQRVAIVNQSFAVMDEAVEKDNFKVAAALAQQALTAARKAKNAVLIRRATGRADMVQELGAAYAGVESLVATLQQNPQDPAANLAVGKYYCLAKDDWQKGLPMLTLGSDPALKQLAEQELAAPTSSDAQAKLADAWWELAEKQEDAAQRPYRLRAAHWYVRAAPDTGGEHAGLSGIKGSLVENRLNSVYAQPRYALVFDGQATRVEVPFLHYDGSHPITLEAIVMLAAAGQAQQVLSNQEFAGLGLAVSSSGCWEFPVREGKRWRTAISSKSAVAKEWVHLAGVFDGQNVALFVNGRLQPTRGIVQGKHKPSGFPFVVGANPGKHWQFSKFFGGLIDEIRVSKTVKYIKNFVPKRRLTHEGDTLLLLHFDEGEGLVAFDSSASKHHGTITGGRWVEIRGEALLLKRR